MNLYGLLLKNFRNNLKKYSMFMMTCLVAIIGLFITLSLRYATNRMEMNDNIMSMIDSSCFFVIIISVVFIRYAIISYIKTRIKDYEIYSILGMSMKIERRLICLEFISMSFFVMLIGEFTGSFLILLFRKICSKILYLPINNYLNAYIYTFTMFLFLVSLVISVLLYKVKKKEKVKNNKKIIFNKFTIGYVSLAIGSLLILISVKLIICFSVGNMILAVIMNPLGLYLVCIFIVNVIIPYIKRKENIYYKKLVIFSDLFVDFKNKILISLIIYMSNFLFLYIVSSSLVDLIDNDVPYDDYFKHDIVIQSQDDTIITNIKNAEDFYYCKYKICDVVGTQIYNNAKIIMNKNYNKIMQKNMKLCNNEVYIFVQRLKEDFPAAAIGKDAVNINSKIYDINIINTGWEYLYTCLDSIGEIFIVVSDDFYSDLSADEGIFIFANNSSFLDYEDFTASQKNQITIYDKEKLVGKMKMENILMLLIFFSISLILLLDGSFIIYVKMFSETPEKRLEFELLEIIGMKRNQIKKTIRFPYKIIIDMPIYLSLLFALFLGISNIIATPGLHSNYVMEYVFFVILIFLAEVLYVIFLKTKIMKEIV